MSETKHIPTPWDVSRDHGDCHVRDAEGTSLICDMQYYPWAPSEEDMGFIVEAVNNHERLAQRVQELEKALKSAASTAHYRGVLRGASDFCHGSFDECTNCACWKTILAGAQKEAAK